MELFSKWADIGLEDALPLLSNRFAANSFYNKELASNLKLIPVYTAIRRKAVETLLSQDEEVIELILLQLVQAYRYENFRESTLEEFFREKMTTSLKMANSYHWLVYLEKENKANNEGIILEQFTQLYGYFMDKLEEDHPDYFENITLQLAFRENNVKTAYEIRNCKGDNKEQVAMLRKTITNGKEQDLTNLNNGQGVPMSANLDYYLHKVVVEKSKVFTSATRPLRLPFKYRMEHEQTERDDMFMMMFKTGDDMRQDKLCLQLF